MIYFMECPSEKGFLHLQVAGGHEPAEMAPKILTATVIMEMVDIIIVVMMMPVPQSTILSNRLKFSSILSRFALSTAVCL